MPGNNSEVKYKLVFARQIQDGADLVIVKEKLKKLFKNKENVVEKLFLQEKIILKKNLSKEDALKNKRIFENTGARCSIIEMKSKKQIAAKTQKAVLFNKEQIDNNTHKVDDLTKVSIPEEKKPIFNKKTIWLVLILIILLIVSWGSLYIINSDYTIITNDENKQDLNKPDVEPSINYLLF